MGRRIFSLRAEEACKTWRRTLVKISAGTSMTRVLCERAQSPN